MDMVSGLVGSFFTPEFEGKLLQRQGEVTRWRTHAARHCTLLQ